MNRFSSFRKESKEVNFKRVPFQLFVYDSRRGNSETTEKEKLLAFYPTETSVDEQLSIVGLAQTIALFSSTFSGDSNFITLDTDKRKWASRNFEPGIWIGINVKKEWGPGKAGDGGLKIFLQDLYNYSVFLYGSVQRLLDIDVTARRARASLQGVVEIWSELLMAKKSEEKAKYENPLDLNSLGVLPSLGLQKAAFLSLHNFINCLCTMDVGFGCKVHRALVCYEQYVLWSGLDGRNTRQLYGFVQKNEMLSAGKGLERGSTLIHLQNEETTTAYWLVPVYKSPLSIFLILDASPQGSISYDQLDENLKSLAGAVITSASKKLAAAKEYHLSGYRYAYVNRLAQMGFASPANKVKTLSSKTTKLLSNIQHTVDVSALSSEDDQDFEIFIKGDHGGWVIAKRIGPKVLYVALDNCEDRNLEGIEEYINTMCNRSFPGVLEL